MNKTRQLQYLRSWVLVHRVSVWINRDSAGAVPKTAIDLSMADLNAALALTSDADTADEKGCRLLVLLKIVHMVTQTKMQVGVSVCIVFRLTYSFMRTQQATSS